MAEKFLNGIRSVDGSSSAPGFSFVGRTDTGMYAADHNTNDRIHFSIDGSQRAYIDANGITAVGNFYAPSGNSFRNYSGVWAATTGLTENGFTFTNTADNRTYFQIQKDYMQFTGDGSYADGATLFLKHSNNNSTDTIGTIFFGSNADATLSKIVAETNGANNTSNLKFGTSNAGTMDTVLTLNADNSATFADKVTLPSNKPVEWPGGSIRAEGNTLKLVATTLIDLQDDTQIQGTLSSGAITANAGGSDTVASFVSTDARARILLQDDNDISYFGTLNGTTFMGTVDTTHANNLTLTSSGYLGIGTISPLEKLHVMYADTTGTATTYAKAVIEDTDAQLDLLSTSAGTWGSAINFVEAAGSDTNTDIWSIARKTTGGNGDSSLNFNFGTNNQHDNTNKVSFSSNGDATFAGYVKAPFFTSDGGRGFKQDSVAFVSTYSNGADANAANDIGSSSNKWRDAYFSGQVNSATISTTGDVTVGDDLLVPKIRLEDINGTVSSLFKIYAWDDELQFTKRNLSTEAHEGTLLALDYSDNSATFAGDITVQGGQIYINDTNTKLEEGTGNAFRVTTDSGYIDIGPKNTGHCHIETNRTNFYFNKELRVNTGIISSYDEDLSLRRASSADGSVNLNIGMLYSTSKNDSQVQLGGFTLNTALEDTYHVYMPGVSPNTFAGAHRKLTVTATKNGTSISAASLANAFLAHEETVSISTSNTDTIIIEISGWGNNYGQWYGITFGAAQWRAKDIDIEISSDNGANYTSIYSENDQPHATVRTYHSGNNTVINKIKYTLTNWNTTSTRINHIFGYKYLTGDTNYLDKYRDETMYSSLNFRDNYAATFGNSGDLVIKHNGNSIIETHATDSVGDLYIKSQGTNHDLYLQAADDILIQPQGSENGIRVHGNDNVELYFNNVRKLRTTNTGINVEGEVVATTLDISGNIQFSDGYLFANSVTSSSTTTTVASVSSSTYTAVFFDYSIKNGTNVRAGTIVATHDGTNVEFNETSTVDLGDTSDVTLSVDLVSSNLSLKATTTSSTWTVKSLVRAI